MMRGLIAALLLSTAAMADEYPPGLFEHSPEADSCDFQHQCYHMDPAHPDKVTPPPAPQYPPLERQRQRRPRRRFLTTIHTAASTSDEVYSPPPKPRRTPAPDVTRRSGFGQPRSGWGGRRDQFAAAHLPDASNAQLSLQKPRIVAAVVTSRHRLPQV